MQKKVRIALDLDGTLNRLPYPFEWFLRHRTGNATFLDLLLLRLIEKLPLSLDDRLLSSIPGGWEVYIITARMGEKNQKTRKQLEKYSLFKEVIFRSSFDVSESFYKIYTAQKKKIDYFFDDRIDTLQALKEAGIEAVDIHEIRKYFK